MKTYGEPELRQFGVDSEMLKKVVEEVRTAIGIDEGWTIRFEERMGKMVKGGRVVGGNEENKKTVTVWLGSCKEIAGDRNQMQMLVMMEELAKQMLLVGTEWSEEEIEEMGPALTTAMMRQYRWWQSLEQVVVVKDGVARTEWRPKNWR